MHDFFLGIACSASILIFLANRLFKNQELEWEHEAQLAYDTGFKLGRVQGAKERKEHYGGQSVQGR